MNSAYAVELTKEIRDRSRWTAVATDIGLVVSGTLLLTLLAQVKIPLAPVPITGQSLGVLLVGACLGCTRSMASVAGYLWLGAMGLPVFAGGIGLAAFAGPTGGFLVSFIPAAGLVGFLCERGGDRTFAKALITFGLGHAVIFGIGVSWLAVLVGWSNAITAGFLPFIPGMIIKTLVATALLPILWTLSPFERDGSSSMTS